MSRFNVTTIKIWEVEKGDYIMEHGSPVKVVAAPIFKRGMYIYGTLNGARSHNGVYCGGSVVIIARVPKPTAAQPRNAGALRR